ncbi:hypothetical protein L195_g062387 [Trifolium pratense]|uniref:Uncharacterized protein n=1 Tax=Trifolium pratense TaxID=57577 RepID=A0A2K3KFD5_TRIPR|nr:hypothetical protein L195_g062387 [Trifolium pratense]
MSGGDDSTRTAASGESSRTRVAFGYEYLNNESHEHSGNRKAPIFNGDAVGVSPRGQLFIIA